VRATEQRLAGRRAASGARLKAHVSWQNMYPKLRCPKCGKRVTPFWFDAEWAQALSYGAGELAAWVIGIALVATGYFISVWALLALLAVVVLLVMPSVYWRVIARGRYYCSRCDLVFPRERLFPREAAGSPNGGSAS